LARRLADPRNPEQAPYYSKPAHLVVDFSNADCDRDRSSAFAFSIADPGRQGEKLQLPVKHAARRVRRGNQVFSSF
jgi:hypothetical protein